MRRSVIAGGLGMLTTLTVAAAIIPVGGVSLWQRWQGARTIHRLAAALNQRDSVALKGLSAHNSAQHLMCMAEHWPEAYYGGGTGHTKVLYRGHYEGMLEYRLVGQPVIPDSAPASLVVDLSRENLSCVEQVAPYPNGVIWQDSFQACINS